MFGCEIVAVQEIIQKADAIQEFANAAKKQDIEQFLRSSLQGDMVDGYLPIIAGQAIAMSEKDANPEEIVTLAKKRLADPASLEQFITACDEALTHEEIKTLIRFHELVKTKPSFCYPMFLVASTILQEILEPYPAAAPISTLSVIHINQNSFKEEVLDSGIPVIVDFYGEYCPPCKQAAPIFSELANELEGKMKFVKLNISEAQELAQEFEIRSIPTFLVFKDGKVIERSTGFHGKDALTLQLLKSFL